MQKTWKPPPSGSFKTNFAGALFEWYWSINLKLRPFQKKFLCLHRWRSLKPQLRGQQSFFFPRELDFNCHKLLARRTVTCFLQILVILLKILFPSLNLLRKIMSLQMPQLRERVLIFLFQFGLIQTITPDIANFVADDLPTS